MTGVQAREAAQQILHEGRFHAPAVPRPLHGALQALGNAITPALHAIGRLVDALASVVPGGRPVAWGIVAAVVLLAAGTLGSLRARRALAGEAMAGAVAPLGAALTAADLEREAARAELDGRLEEALRLRFRWGLASLAERDVIAGAPALPNAELSRRLHSGRFDALADRFDEVAYGGRRAAAEDLAGAREGWRQVLSGGSRP